MQAHSHCSAWGAWRPAFQQARDRWSWGPLSFHEFCTHLTRLGYTSSLPAETASLYLCAACCNGVPGACETLEELYFPGLRLLLRARCGEQRAEDIIQDVRERLLVGPAAKLATYRGDGPLAGWIRRVVLNLASDRMRSDRARHLRLLRLRASESAGHEHGQRSPEELLTEAQLGAACQRALSAILASISRRDQQLLRHAYVANLSIDEIGAMYAVDRSTAARWLKRTIELTRSRLQLALRELLGARKAVELPLLLPTFCRQQDSTFVRSLESLLAEWLAEAPPSLTEAPADLAAGCPPP